MVRLAGLLVKLSSTLQDVEQAESEQYLNRYSLESEASVQETDTVLDPEVAGTVRPAMAVGVTVSVVVPVLAIHSEPLPDLSMARLHT